jgi:ABC-2 type transport system ATP-binding protein
MIIEARALHKTYKTSVKQPGILGTLRHYFQRETKQVHAVRDVTFSIETGEVVGFLGANGAGKTTTLKVLTGLVHPSAGSARVAGYDPFERRTEFLKRITLVMGQKQQLMWDVPALESLRINAAVYEIEEQEAKRRVAELAEMLEIGDKLSQPVRKLSLGERMKCELLAALLHRPDVLFLDEPTLGLDVNAQDTIRKFLNDYNQRHRATVILTSHYMADITALCPRVMLMHEGALIYDGSLSGILDRFAPYREIVCQLREPLAAERLADFGEVEACEGRNVRLLVRREDLTRTVQRLFAELAIEDLSVKDPPIEKVIGKLFRSGEVALPEKVIS